MPVVMMGVFNPTQKCMAILAAGLLGLGALSAWAGLAHDILESESVGAVIRKTDEYHAFLSARVRSAALTLDEWLGGDTYETEAEQNTVLRARVTLKLNEGQLVRIQPALSGHIALPALRNRARLFVDNIARGVVPSREEDRTERDEFRTGFRFDVYRRLRSLIQWDIGAKFNPLPAGFTTATASYRREVGEWIFRLSEQGFWHTDDGFGEITEMNWDRTLTTRTAFRSITAAVWSETTEGIEFEQTGRLTWTLIPNRRYVQLSASALAHKSSAAVMDDYRLTLRYSTALHRSWCFLEIAPQADFPREESFQFTPSLRISLAAYFGGDY